jgi:membrane protease YdiL (CAAX protease family)
MDIPAPAPFPAQPPHTSGAPRHVPWTPRDVGVSTLIFIAVFIFVPIPFVIPFAFSDTESRPALIAALMGGIAVYAGIALIIRSTVAGKYHAGLRALGIRAPGWDTFGWAAVAFIGALAVGAAYAAILSYFDISALQQDCADQVPDSIRNDAVILAITSATAVLLAPPIEEAFFRGFAFAGLLRPWGLAPAVFVSGLMFGSAHLLGNPLLYKSLIQFALIGMVFALVYWKSNNLLSTITAHFVFNLMGVVVIAATTCDDTCAIALFRHWGDTP